MQIRLTIEIWRKGGWFISKCPELDFVSQGKTREESQQNLKEVIQIQMEEMSQLGTLEEYFQECGYTLSEGIATPEVEMVGLERLDLELS